MNKFTYLSKNNIHEFYDHIGLHKIDYKNDIFYTFIYSVIETIITYIQYIITDHLVDDKYKGAPIVIDAVIVPIVLIYFFYLGMKYLELKTKFIKYISITTNNMYDYINSDYYFNYIFINNDYIKINYSIEIIVDYIYTILKIIIVIGSANIFDTLIYNYNPYDTWFDIAIIIPYLTYAFYKEFLILKEKVKFDKFIEVYENIQKV